MKRKIANRYFTSEKLADYSFDNWSSSRLCNIDEWDDPIFFNTAREIMGSKDAPKHRKLWEFTATVLALKELGLLNKNSIGISVAAGNERILFYLAKHLAGVIATDIYGEGNFLNNEANISFLDNQKAFAPYPYPEKNLCAAYSNALNLKFPDNSFDFSFCLSSIEHFGGIKNSRKAILEMDRVTKPGGYVLIATEISINGLKTDEVFNLSDIDRLIRNSNLELNSKFNFSLSNNSLNYLCDMSKDDLGKLPHINLKSLCSIFTSGLLVLRKKGSLKISMDIQNDKERLWQIAENLKKTKQIDLRTSLKDRVIKKLVILVCKLQEKFI